eukprot:97460-Rhodomonas_salina.1
MYPGSGVPGYPGTHIPAEYPGTSPHNLDVLSDPGYTCTPGRVGRLSPKSGPVLRCSNLGPVRLSSLVVRNS